MRKLTLLAAVAAVSAASAAFTAPETPAKPTAVPPKPAAAMQFKPVELDLAPGETYLVELSVPNASRKERPAELHYTPETGVTVLPDARYTGKLGRYGVKTYPKITAAPTATGMIPVKATVAGEGEATLTVRIVEPTVELVPGLRKLTVKVSNPFRTRLLNGRVQLSNPDRFLENITTREFKVAPGEMQELVFPLPGAAPVDGESYDFEVIVETYQGFRSKKTYPLTFPPHT